jgi:hypothetical protein
LNAWAFGSRCQPPSSRSVGYLGQNFTFATSRVYITKPDTQLSLAETATPESPLRTTGSAAIAKSVGVISRSSESARSTKCGVRSSAT